MKSQNNILEQQEYTRKVRSEVKKRADRLINYFLTCYFLGGLVFASFYDTWFIAIGIGGLLIAAYYSTKIILPQSNLYQYVLSVVLGIFMAQYIYQMHGLFEMHFFAFIGSAILITYQNWKLQIPMLLVVVIHHLAFGYLQNSGVENVYFTQLDYFELQTFIIHFLLAAVIFFVCGLWSYQLKKYSELQINHAMESARFQKEAMMERELMESNKRFSYAAQATSDAIWDRNYSEDTIFWGEGYKTLFGYDVNEETTSIDFWASKICLEDLERVSAIIAEAKNNPDARSWKCEYRFLKSNGEYAYVRERAIILRDEKGIPARTIGALQDITESKKNEITLKQLNENLEKEKYFLDSLMDNMPDAIYFKDRESRFIRVSKHMADKFGTTLNDIVGKSDFDFHDREKAELAFKDEKEIMETRTAKIDYIEKSVKKDGTDRWVSTTKMPLINTRGELVGTFGMSRDVTQVKSLEEARHAADLDKAVAQGKFEIASDVMHDIGNAVVGFGSYLTRIRRTQEQDNPENLQQLASFFEGQKAGMQELIGEAKAGAVVKMLDSIAQQQKNSREEISRTITQQLNIITHIQEILDIQRQYISGHQQQERKPVNLRNIINDSLAMLYNMIDKMAIVVSLNVTAENPVIKGDRTKLMQLLLNILKNSIEAIDPGAPEKSLGITVHNGMGRLVIEVKDSGAGFDEQTANKLFERGFTTKATGSGLGLANCRSIMESHEGEIKISSGGVGKGAVTKIQFNL